MTNQQPQKTPESELKAKDKPESLLLNLTVQYYFTDVDTNQAQWR